jgi:hypothetical protein
MMTTTVFLSPTTINQVTIPNEITGISSIDWTGMEYITNTGSYAVSKKPLYTISGMWMEKFLSNTSQLWLTGFNIPNSSSTLTGIEFQLNIQRAARIEDLIIQLTLQGELIGENQASLVNPVQSDMYTGDFTTPLQQVGDYNVYGGSTNLWGSSLTSTDVTDPTFGIVISFKSNQIYPHSDLAYVNQVAVRVTYA